jgi:ABC-type branched-subunit amino acid transport system permease subunit
MKLRAPRIRLRQVRWSDPRTPDGVRRESRILIYVRLGWALNNAMGLAGLLRGVDLVGAYSCALLSTNYGLSYWIRLPWASILATL